MSIWDWLRSAGEGGAGAFGALLGRAGGLLGGPADASTRRQVAYSMALIALSAKMAKADGVVVDLEVAAFEKMFVVPAGERRNVDRLFRLAQQDVAGFETYAARVADFFGEDREALADVLDGLFAIAGADGAVHQAEYAYLERVAQILGIDEARFERIAARHVIGAEGDPYVILGVERSATFVEIRVRYRRLAAENHPDILLGRGLPPAAAAIAHERMARINRAFQRIAAERRE
mgnify:FL=1